MIHITHLTINDLFFPVVLSLSSQLAILGACMCRGHRTEPCGCAYSAANLHRELLKIKEDVQYYFYYSLACLQYCKHGFYYRLRQKWIQILRK